ncbi:MAG TPA: T9SS type A sorting domain-containing protein [bacterium]|nr:T9SS type A sorting domain-containing protein [bacterium]
MKKILLLFLMMLFSTIAFADFSLYLGSQKDYGCDVAYNSTNNEYLVVWLESYSTQMKRLKGVRISESGQPGTNFTISEYAQGLPSVAYNSQQNEYLVVFVSGIAPDLSVYGQRLSAAGSTIGGTIQLIPNAENPTVRYNSIAGNFLVVGEEKIPDNLQTGYSYTRYYSGKIAADGQPIGSAQMFYNSYPTSFVDTDDMSYTIAYAPVTSSETPQGRYLLAYNDPGNLMMLDSDGNAMITLTNPQSGEIYPSVPFQQSKISIAEGWDIAFGYWDNEPVFLIVWADRDNDMTWQGLQWTGIWGGLIDAEKIDYLTTESVANETFPISKIWSHWAYSSYSSTWNPVVEYSSASGKFMVAWRETPGLDPQNDTQVNHIRGNSMGSAEFTGSVPDNIIISATTGTEDPFNPAIAVSSVSPHALVVWEDKRNFGTYDFDIYGNLLETTVANNTPIGGNVNVNLGSGVNVTFNNVTNPGSTTLVTTSSGTPPPGGFQIVPFGSPVYYNIETTATFTGSIEICINYNDAGMTPAQEAALRLQVYEDPPGQWKDITTLLNTTTNIICGSVNHLSEFAIIFSTGAPDINVTPSSITTSVGDGGPTTETLVINNSGDADLYFNISDVIWEKMPGAASDISVGADGAAWMIGTNKNDNGYDIYRWNGADWDAIPGGAITIDVGSQSQVVVVNETNDIFKWDGSDWYPLSGKALQVSVASDGTMWAIGANKIFGGYEILKWNGNGWDLMPGGAVKISVGSQNHIWCVNEFSLVYRWNGSDWDLFPGIASDINVGADGSVWAIGAIPATDGYEIFKWNGSGWDKKYGGAVAVSVGSADHIWTVDDSGDIFRWNSSGADFPTWLKVSPLTGTVSSGSQQDIGVTFDATGLLPNTYNANIFIMSNDPDETIVQIPVTLEVLQSGFPIIRFDPRITEMRVGTPASVDVVLEGIIDLGSFEFEITYDGAVLQIVQDSDVTQGIFLGSTGRTIIPVGPTIDNTSGAIVYGAASLGTQPGASGDGVLATILWTPLAEGISPIDLKNIKIADTQGAQIAVQDEDGEIHVTSRFWADVDGDQDVDIIDIQLVAAHWNTKQGDANFDPIYDVDNQGQGDGDVDIIDVQLVASWWNKQIPSNSDQLQNTILVKSTRNKNVLLQIKANETAASDLCPSLSVFVESAANIGAFQFDVVLKNTDVTVSGIQLGEFLSANGDNVTQLGPVKKEGSDRYVMGAFSYGSHNSIEGEGLLATINLEGTIDHFIPVEITNIILTDMNGQQIELNAINAEYLSWNKNLATPENFALHQNYPNPFNPTTFISYDVLSLENTKQHVSLRIFNLQGQLVQTLVDEEKTSGTYRIQWNGLNAEGIRVPSGIYIYTLQADEFKTSGKMLLIK